MRDTKLKHNKEALLKALKLSNGIVSMACESVGLDRSSYYRYYNSDKKFKKSADETSERAIDFVESKLFNRINAGSDTAIIFFLKTKAKKRGYVERQEFAGPEDENGLPTAITVNVIHTQKPTETNDSEKPS